MNVALFHTHSSISTNIPVSLYLSTDNDFLDHTVPNECKHHGVLDSMDRAQGFYDPFVSLTDAGLTPGWYRFKDSAGE